MDIVENKNWDGIKDFWDKPLSKQSISERAFLIISMITDPDAEQDDYLAGVLENLAEERSTYFYAMVIGNITRLETVEWMESCCADPFIDEENDPREDIREYWRKQKEAFHREGD